MKIIRLELQNFKPFRKLTLPETDDELPGGLIIVRGPNSTGKSSIFEAILWALWGHVAVEPTNDELINFASSFCEVRLEFEVAGTRYEINRSYDPAKGMSVVLSEEKKGKWKRIADKSMTVGRMMDEILNLEPQQALQTLLVRQGEVALIANATPSVLRDLLVKVYNIELLGEMTKQLENLERNLTAQTDVKKEEYRAPEHIREQIESIEERIDIDEKELKIVQEESKKAEKDLEKLPNPKDLKRASNILEKLRMKEQEHDRSIRSRDKELRLAGIVDADTRIIRARLDSLKNEGARLEKEKEDVVEKSFGIERNIGAHEGLIRDLEEKTSLLEGKEAICPTCNQPLSDHDCERVVTEYRGMTAVHKAKIGELEKDLDAVPTEIKDIDDRLRAIHLALDAAKRLTEQQVEVEGLGREVEAIAKKLGVILEKMEVDSVEKLLKKHKVKDIVDLQTYIQTLSKTLISNKTYIESANKRIEKDKSQVKELEATVVKMRELGAEIESLENLKEHTRYVRRKLVSGFISDYVFQKRLIGIIRKATNRYVDAFTNGQYTSIDLEPTAAKGRGGAGLLLRIWDERDKAKKRTAQLSFGDRTAISLGLRLGISRTMSSIRPFKESPAIAPRVRSVLLDEPLGGLDSERRISVVKNLVGDESFEQIFLITHTDVRGWEGVPVIEVSKTGSASDAILALSPDT